MVARRQVTVMALVATFALSLVACGGSNDKESSGDEGGATVSTAANGTPVAVELGETSDTEYFLKATPASVPAGPVTFTAKNTGTKEHEMVVLKTDEAPDALKVTGDRVSEDASVGEIGETKAGKTGTFTANLKAGKYVLVCNIEKHYSRHMYTAFTVT